MMSKEIIRQDTISAEYHGQRIDAVLAALYPEFSRSLLTRWVKEGSVKLNGKTCKPKDKVLVGDTVNMKVTLANHYETDQLQAQNIPLSILYEDEDILILNKPAGLVVHPGAGNPDQTLVNALLHHSAELSQLPRAGIIHRLDKDTTGLMVVAKSLAAHTELSRQMQAREIHRHYQALVHGYLVSGGEIDTAFGRHPRNRLKMAVTTQGRQATTLYKINTHFTDFTLLDIQLLTGRTHQIRVHMAHINHPVLGDQLYGGRTRFPKHANEELRLLIQSFKRQALHACRLRLNHPLTQVEVDIQAPLPEDFQHLLKALKAHDEDKDS